MEKERNSNEIYKINLNGCKHETNEAHYPASQMSLQLKTRRAPE